MRKKKIYQQITKRIYRPEMTHCVDCGSRLRRTVTISARTVITLKEVVKVVHRGYRCPLPDCPGHKRLYRSSEADALALPGFTFGLDIVLFVGHLRLREHKTVDEIHAVLSQRLIEVHQTISRREVLFLFETYAALVRAGTEVAQDEEWKAQVRANQGLLLSIDGIQPDNGNETIYLVRDVWTGRLLTADNVTDSTKNRLKQVLAPIVALDLPVIGVISDAQPTELQAVADLWPQVPHQICQFHAIREAGRLIYTADHRVRNDVRIRLQQKIHEYRQDLHRRIKKVEESKKKNVQDLEQFQVLEEYAAMVEGALNLDSLTPFQYGGLAMQEALDQIQTSLEKLEKKRGAVITTSKKRLVRLTTIVRLHEEQAAALAQVRRMYAWVMEVEHIFDGSWAQSTEEISNEAVGQRLDGYLERLSHYVEARERTEEEKRRLGHLWKVLTHLRPGLVQCYDVARFPRTNNDMERTIRAIKMHYRRISGRKNWSTYLLRYGRCVAYQEWWHQQSDGEARLQARLLHVVPASWRQVRRDTRDCHQEQLHRYRFRHRPLEYLAALEKRWEQASGT